jgi:TatD family-associated radical SAM protein
MNSNAVYCLPCKPGSVYVNTTDRCLNACLFCIKRDGPMFYGRDLFLHGTEPTTHEIVASLAESLSWEGIREVVFCGMGEPLLRYDCVQEVCGCIRRTRGEAVSIRVDTSGLFWAQRKRLDLLDQIDTLCVSLNAETPDKYQELCQPKIDDAYGVLFDFLKAVKAWEMERRCGGLPFPDVRLSVVDTTEDDFIPLSGRKNYAPGKFPVPDFDACRRIADEFGWKFVVKRLFRDSCDTRWDDPDVQDRLARGIPINSCKGCSFRH